VRFLPALDFDQVEALEPSEGALVLPCFPLGDDAYLPESKPGLNIFEPRYRQMYSDILFSGGRRFIVPPTRQEDPGQVKLAEVGVVFYLDDLQEVSEQTGDQVKYICKHSVIGRVRLKKVLNPRAFADRSTYLKVECEDLVDSDEDADLSEAEANVEGLVFNLQELQGRSGGRVGWPGATGNATRGAGFWNMVSSWREYLLQRASLRKAQFDKDLQERIVGYLREAKGEVPSQISIGELPESLQKEVVQMKQQFSEDINPLVQVYRESAQVLVQSESHGERLQLLSDMLEQERKRLEAQVALKGIFDEK
jgi:Lon protease-like protein